MCVHAAGYLNIALAFAGAHLVAYQDMQRIIQRDIEEEKLIEPDHPKVPRSFKGSRASSSGQVPFSFFFFEDLTVIKVTWTFALWGSCGKTLPSEAGQQEKGTT